MQGPPAAEGAEEGGEEEARGGREEAKEAEGATPATRWRAGRRGPARGGRARATRTTAGRTGYTGENAFLLDAILNHFVSDAG